VRNLSKFWVTSRVSSFIEEDSRQEGGELTTAKAEIEELKQLFSELKQQVKNQQVDTKQEVCIPLPPHFCFRSSRKTTAQKSYLKQI
jgi:hypothetical protein